MNVYISHARKDDYLALQLATRLESEGMTIVHPEMKITPEENWAKKLGRALQDSDFMVFLLTPGAFEADWMAKDVEFALGARKYKDHVFSVFVGPAPEMSKEVPWILRKLPHRRVATAKGFAGIAKEIEALCAVGEKSPSHA